jgi:hypothetical protein
VPSASSARDPADESNDLPAADAWAAATDDIDGDLDSAARDAAPPPIGSAAPVTAVVAANGRATTGIRIRALTRKVRIIGDPSVSTVSVDGPHEMRREGTTLVIDSDRDLPFGDPFQFLPTGRGRFRVLTGGRSFGLNTDLVLRANPELEIDVDVTAGSLLVRDVGRVRARVTAGSARVESVRGPLDIHVVGGTAKIDSIVQGADNRIRCESGSVVLRLRPGSDVRFRPEAQLGRIVVDGLEGGREIAVGAGQGRLRAEVVMGSIQVEVPA